MFLFCGVKLSAVVMKFLFIVVGLICTILYFCQADNTTGSKKVCASPVTPITINVHGKGGQKGEKGEKGDTGTKGDKGDKGTSCKCPLQDPNKPSAHIEAANKRTTSYQANTVIKDWDASNSHSHLAGGMTYKDGKLTVPLPGRYYIYAQIYYLNNGRVHVRVNNRIVSMMQPRVKGSDEGTLYTGGVFNLKAGDVITLDTNSWPVSTIKIYMYAHITYFGAFLI